MKSGSYPHTAISQVHHRTAATRGIVKGGNISVHDLNRSDRLATNWHDIRGILWKWMTVMAGIAFYFAIANLVCTKGQCGNSTLSYANLIGLVSIVAIGVWAALNLMRSDTQLLFTPLVSYAAASALFYGFGPMSNFVANRATIRFAEMGVYGTSSEGVLRANLLVSTGITISLAAILITLPRRRTFSTDRRELSLKFVALSFVVVGLAIKHLIIMPSVYGTSQFFVPGVLSNLRYVPDLGFALMAMIAASGDRRWHLIFWWIWPWHLLLAFPEFSKRAVMLTILLPALGAYVGHRSLKRLACWAIAAGLVFTVLQGANEVGRWAESEIEERHLTLGVSDRLKILANAVSSGYEPALSSSEEDEVQRWWLRLNYAGPQAKAMALYDRGVTGGFTQNPLTYFVPRLIWPDKPVMASPGRAFHALVTGRHDNETKVGISVFADGYLRIGWIGLIIFSSIMGLIIGVISRMTMGQMRSRRFLFLPAAMIGLSMGATSTTQFLQNSFIAPLPIYFGYVFLVSLVYSQLGKQKRNRRHNSVIAAEGRVR